MAGEDDAGPQKADGSDHSGGNTGGVESNVLHKKYVIESIFGYDHH